MPSLKQSLSTYVFACFSSILFSLAFSSKTASAATLDPTFGYNGSVKLAVGLPLPEGGSLAAMGATKDAKGRTYVAVSPLYSGTTTQAAFIMRLLPDWMPDPSFGRNGVVDLPDEASLNPNTSAAILIDALGRVLVPVWQSNTQGDGVIALSEDGTVNQSFGDKGRSVHADVRTEFIDGRPR